MLNGNGPKPKPRPSPIPNNLSIDWGVKRCNLGTIQRNRHGAGPNRRNLDRQGKDVSVVDNGDGTITIQQAVVGLAERMTLPDGTVLYSDRGRIVFELVIDLNGTPLDASDDIFVEDHGIVSVSGPHPQAASDFTLACDVLPEALTTP